MCPEITERGFKILPLMFKQSLSRLELTFRRYEPRRLATLQRGLFTFQRLNDGPEVPFAAFVRPSADRIVAKGVEPLLMLQSTTDARVWHEHQAPTAAITPDIAGVRE